MQEQSQQWPESHEYQIPADRASDAYEEYRSNKAQREREELQDQREKIQYRREKRKTREYLESDVPPSFGWFLTTCLIGFGIWFLGEIFLSFLMGFSHLFPVAQTYGMALLNGLGVIGVLGTCKWKKWGVYLLFAVLALSLVPGLGFSAVLALFMVPGLGFSGPLPGISATLQTVGFFAIFIFALRARWKYFS